MLIVFVFVFFLGLHLRHMEVPRLGVEAELQLPAYTTAIVTPDPSHVFDLCPSFRPCWILNPVNEARDRTHILMHTSQVCKPLNHNGSFLDSIFQADV